MPVELHAHVTATPEALEIIERLRAVHGPLAFHQSGGCCDGSAPMCLLDAELPPGPGDVRLGEIGGAPFYVDGELWERWGRPAFAVGVAAGAAESFSLEGSVGVHFVSNAPAAACPTDCGG